MLATYSFRRKQDFWGAIQQKSLSLVEKIRVLTKSCKNPRLFDIFSGLTVGLLELFLDHQKQNFKQNSKVPKSAYTKNAQKTVPLTERLYSIQVTSPWHWIRWGAGDNKRVCCEAALTPRTTLTHSGWLGHWRAPCTELAPGIATSPCWRLVTTKG